MRAGEPIRVRPGSGGTSAPAGPPGRSTQRSVRRALAEQRASARKPSAVRQLSSIPRSRCPLAPFVCLADPHRLDCRPTRTRHSCRVQLPRSSLDLRVGPLCTRLATRRGGPAHECGRVACSPRRGTRCWSLVHVRDSDQRPCLARGRRRRAGLIAFVPTDRNDALFGCVPTVRCSR